MCIENPPTLDLLYKNLSNNYSEVACSLYRSSNVSHMIGFICYIFSLSWIIVYGHSLIACTRSLLYIYLSSFNKEWHWPSIDCSSVSSHNIILLKKSDLNCVFPSRRYVRQLLLKQFSVFNVRESLHEFVSWFCVSLLINDLSFNYIV